MPTKRLPENYILVRHSSPIEWSSRFLQETCPIWFWRQAIGAVTEFTSAYSPRNLTSFPSGDTQTPAGASYARHANTHCIVVPSAARNSGFAEYR
mgnify:CR=1 FL=1